MRGVAQRLALLNLLVDQGEWVLEVGRLLLVEWRHAKLLMGQRGVLASRGPVAVVGVVPEVRLARVAESGQDGVHTSEESFVLYRHGRRFEFDGDRTYLR